MDQARQLELIEKRNAECIAMMKSKGHDYAGEDILKNFKQMQQMLALLEVDATTLEGTHMFYILLKVQRLCNLVFSGKEGKNESINDTLLDLRNYTDLFYLTRVDKEDDKNKFSSPHE